MTFPKTKQEVYDIVMDHLWHQNKQAGKQEPDLAYFSCLYRAPDGSKCAIGCLIPDELYDPVFESNDIDYMMDHINGDDQNQFYSFLDRNHHLLMELQLVHDEYKSSHHGSFREYLIEASENIADQFGLILHVFQSDMETNITV